MRRNKTTFHSITEEAVVSELVQPKRDVRVNLYTTAKVAPIPDYIVKVNIPRESTPKIPAISYSLPVPGCNC